ncbi:MAG: glycosyltransferase family 39 protein [Gemmatimonadota bacterium]
MTTRRAYDRPWILALLWAVAVLVVAILVRRFWIPLDDGTLAQSAERVLGGELPHRDFGDPYTGLNALIGAVAFDLLGISLLSLRIPLVVGFSLWLPAVWLVARRFADPDVSVVVTALAALLSVLTYPAAMPTWFGLFTVTWGLVALLAYVDRASRRWLLAVGAAAGVAVLFKVVGLYFLAAAFVTVAWARADGSRHYRTVTVAGVGLFLLLLGRMVLPRTNETGLVHFFVPGLCLGVALTVQAWRGRPGPGRGLGPLLSDGAILSVGALAPVLVFLVPYMASASVGAWTEGVFFLPERRFGAASSGPAALWTASTGMAAVALMVLGTRVTGAMARRGAIALGALLTAGLALDDYLDGAALTVFWYSARTWIPVLTAVAAWQWLTRRPEPGEGSRESQASVAVVSTAALWSLVQFPYSSPAYFFYAAPLGVLATMALLHAAGRRRPGPVAGVLAALYTFLGAGYVAGVAASSTTPLALERGGIRVSEADAEQYARMTEVVRTHGRGGDIWAGPDAPEVYFLSGKPNRTPVIYEFLTPSSPTPEELVRFLDTRTVVVINSRPLFSAPLSDDVQARLTRAFPEEEAIGPYIVRWRSP